MKVVYMLYFLQLFLSHPYCIAAEDYRQAHFSIASNSIYIPFSAARFLANITSKYMSNLPTCAQQCLNDRRCRTAAYYQDIKTCSLFSENSDVGQISTVANQVSFVLSMTMSENSTVTVPSSSGLTWSVNGTTVAGSPAGIAGSSLRQLFFPNGIYYDRSYKQIIVSDYSNHRILRFSLTNLSANGVVMAGGNSFGCSLNQFQSVYGVALDSLRQLYVADHMCDRIVRFPPNSSSATVGVLIASVVTPQGLFINPLTDDIYVSLDSPSVVMKIDRNSSTSVVFAGGNGFGNGLNQFNKPVGVYFDYLNTNSLYVADSQNNRVIRFPANSTGATNGIIVAGGNGAGSASNQLNWPRSVFADQNGILYITDQNNQRVQRWLPNATSGDTIAGGAMGTAPDQFSSPEGLFMDENGNLFVVDRFNHRVQFFNAT